jgi:hypothetical protein
MNTDTLAIVRHVLESPENLTDLARRHALDIDGLLEWFDSGRHGSLDRLRRLADVQVQLMVSQYRRLAVSRLIRIVCNDEIPAETARRAAADLIGIELPYAALPPGDDAGDESPLSLRAD